jgi:NAD(P)H-flavin reductase
VNPAQSSQSPPKRIGQPTENISASSLAVTDNLQGWATVTSPPRPYADRTQLTVSMNHNAQSGLPTGLFFLARAGILHPSTRLDKWEIYLPCALPAIACQTTTSDDRMQPKTEWTLLLPPQSDPRHAWFAARQVGENILIFGPYGNRLNLNVSQSRQNLLVIARDDRLALVLEAIHQFLDQSGHVTVMLLAKEPEQPLVHALVHALPLQVEVQHHQSLEPSGQFINTVRWADRILIVVENQELEALAYTIQRARFQTAHDELAYAYVIADYLCGYGACLACTVPTASGGITRACVHGPIFPLSALVAR